MKIRAATLGDLPALLTLQHLAFQSEAELYPETVISPMSQTLPDLESEFSHFKTLVAEECGELVGLVRGQVMDGNGEIGRLMVHPARRERGLGRELMRAIEAALNVPSFKLFTGQRSLGNLRLYESLGYARSGQFAAGPINMIELTKTLSYEVTK